MAEHITFPGQSGPGELEISIKTFHNVLIEEIIDKYINGADLEALLYDYSDELEGEDQIIVPAKFVDEMGNDIPVPEGDIPEDTPLKFCMLTDDDDATWMAAFTRCDEIGPLENEDVILLSLADLMGIALEEEGCKGVVVNPFGDPMEIPCEVISEVITNDEEMPASIQMLAEGIVAYDMGDHERALDLYNQAARMIVDVEFEETEE